MISVMDCAMNTAPMTSSMNVMGHGDDDELAAHDFFGGVGFGRFAAVFAQVVHDAAGLCGFVLA